MGSERMKICDICQKTMKPRGWATHRKACEKKAENHRLDQRIAASIQRQKGTLTFEQCQLIILQLTLTSVLAAALASGSNPRRTNPSQQWGPGTGRCADVPDVMDEGGESLVDQCAFVFKCQSKIYRLVLTLKSLDLILNGYSSLTISKSSTIPIVGSRNKFTLSLISNAVRPHWNQLLHRISSHGFHSSHDWSLKSLKLPLKQR